MRTLTSFVACIAVAPSARAQLGANHCQAIPNSTGAAATLIALGTPDVAVNDVVLHGGSLPPGALSMLVSSTQRAVLPGFAGTANTLCLGGSLGRHVATAAIADPAGTVAIPLDTQQVPHPTQPFGLVRGDTLNFQLWFRDALPGGVPTSGLSDGLSITFCPVELFEGERLGLPIGSDFALARDMDGDGAVDIVCTNHETVSVAFGAQGGGYGRAVVLPVLAPVSSPYSLNDAIDTDGNGLLDILLPTSNGPWVPSRLALIEQMAPRQFAPLRLLPITDLYEQARAADVDGDGDIDIVAVAAGRAEFHVLLGDGHGAFVRVQAVPAPAGATIKNLAAADLTRDGASEVYLSSGLFTLEVYAWNGTQQLVRTAERSITSTATVHFIDTDTDGDDDYVVAAGSSNYVAVLRNEGGGVLATLQERYPTPPGAWLQAHEDIDSDGDVDLAFVLEGGIMQTLWNDGYGVFYPTNSVDLRVPGLTTRFADVDGDGRFEAVDIDAARRWLGVRARIGAQQVAAYSVAPMASVAGSPIGVLDVDGDGFEELATLVAGELELVHYAAGWDQPQGVRYTGVTLPTELEFADADGDADLDLFALFNNNSGVAQLAVHVQTSPLQFALGVVLPVAADVQLLLLDDLDGNGLADAILMGFGGTRVDVYLNQGLSWLGPISTTADQLQPGTARLADVTRDGRPDLVYRGNFALSVCEGLPGGGFGARLDLGIPPGLPAHNLQLADLDGDGFVDLITQQAFLPYAMAVYRSIGANAFANGDTTPLPGSQPVSTIDVDGDGDFDVLAPLVQHGIVLYENDGDATLRAPRYIQLGMLSTGRLLPGDLDHDGDADLLCSEAWIWRVLESRCR